MSRKKITDSVSFLGFSSRVRQVRGNLTQNEFGKVLGVRDATISRYESGRVPDAQTLKDIADHGGVTVEWLLYGDKALPGPDEAITIESPALPSVLHSPYLFGAIDTGAMTQIIEMVEELLSKRKKPLKPVKKALLLSLLYDEFQKTGQPLNQITLKEFLRRVD